MTIQFVVENAGCVSCGELIRGSLSAIGDAEVVDIDEDADVATVRLASTHPVSVEDVDQILEVASEGSAHAYCVQPGSWTTQTAR